MNQQDYGASIGPTPMAAEAVVNRANIPQNTEMQAPPRSPNLARGIIIEQLNHGYIITVGCQRFAVENRDSLLHRLATYLGDPERTESEWMKGNLKW